MRFATTMLIAGAAVLAGACATTGGERSGSSSGALTAEEIQAAGTHIRTAYDAVEQLRPQFMRTRANPTVSGRSIDPVRVYVNGTLWGGVEALRRVRAEEIVQIRHVRPTDATTRYGLDHGSGAIEVVTVGR